MLSEAHRQRAQPAAAVIGGIRIQRLAHQIGVFAQTIPAAGVGDRRAQHGVGMANGVLGASLNRNIHPVVQRLKQHSRRPGVIDHDNDLRIYRADRVDHSRHILDFHGY